MAGKIRTMKAETCQHEIMVTTFYFCCCMSAGENEIALAGMREIITNEKGNFAATLSIGIRRAGGQ